MNAPRIPGKDTVLAQEEVHFPFEMGVKQEKGERRYRKFLKKALIELVDSFSLLNICIIEISKDMSRGSDR